MTTRMVTTIALLALAGCGDPAPMTVADAGIIVEIPDAGPPDSGGPEDAGDGTCGMSITINGWGQLPDSCLPRCSAATRAAAEACDIQACQWDAWLADDTPEVLVQTYAGPLGVSCGGEGAAYPCFAWQTYSCQADTCPTEYSAWATCRAGGGACTEEQTALTSCNEASLDFEPCVTMRVAACYAG